MVIENIKCEHCDGVFAEVTVNQLPMDCPLCGAPLLALCQMTTGGRWERFPEFPNKVDVNNR